MGIPVHTINFMNGLIPTLSNSAELKLGVLTVPFGAGGGAGATVTVQASTILPPDLPTTALFFPAALGGATVSTTGSLAAGNLAFVINPGAGNTLAAGSASVLVLA